MKKGQLTVFIIIGIILILLIGMVIYFTQREVLAPVERERVRVIKVPTEAQPLQDFVQTCVFIVAKEGLERLGQRGGYIEPKQTYNPFEPTAEAAVQFAPGSELKVPYWWHMNANNKCVGDCTFATERPTLPNVERQLEGYIGRELPGCLGDFKTFREQGYTITPTDRIDPDVRLTEGNVLVFVEYPMEMARADERIQLKEFTTELPVEFYKMYVLGTTITALQAEHAFLERATRSLIDIFGRTDESALPPVTEMEFGFGTGTYWTKFDVLEKVKQMLTSYVPLLKVTYTNNYKFLPAPAGKNREFYEVLYNHGFTVPVLDPANRDLNVKFTYLPWWKPYMDLNCNGQLCQAEGFSNTFAFLFGVRRYNFAYDVSYPVLVEIESPQSFNGEGYSLRFMLEANMRNNEPLAKLEPPLEIPDLKERSSLLCDPSQRTSGNITVNVRASNGQPIDKAEIVYVCGTETCGMGRSANGKLVTEFPRCVGGFVSSTHAEYALAVLPFDVIDKTEQTVDLIMGTPYEVDFSVKKYLLKKQQITRTIRGEERTYDTQNWDLDTSSIFNQGPYEDTIIMLEREGPEYEEPIIIFGNVCGGRVFKAKMPCGDPAEDISKDIRIYPGKYHVQIYSFMYPAQQLTIPPNKRCFDRGPGRSDKCVWVPPKPIVFNIDKPLMSGFAEYDWTVTDAELAGAEEIEFTYINFALDKLRPPSRRMIEDLEVMGNMGSYSDKYQDLLVPRIK